MTSARKREWLNMLIGWVGQLLCFIVVEGFIVYEVTTTPDAAMRWFMVVLAGVIFLPIWAITCEFIPDAWAEYRKGD